MKPILDVARISSRRHPAWHAVRQTWEAGRVMHCGQRMPLDCEMEYDVAPGRVTCISCLRILQGRVSS